MAVAIAADVGTALGRNLTDAETARVDWWLNGLEIVIGARLGDVAALDQDVLRYVLVEAAIAKLDRAGRSESSITVSVDDGSVTRRYDMGVSADDINGNLWGLLSPANAASAYTVSVTSALDV